MIFLYGNIYINKNYKIIKKPFKHISFGLKKLIKLNIFGEQKYVRF